MLRPIPALAPTSGQSFPCWNYDSTKAFRLLTEDLISGRRFSFNGDNNQKVDSEVIAWAEGLVGTWRYVVHFADSDLVSRVRQNMII